MNTLSHTTKGRVFIGGIMLSLVSLILFFTNGPAETTNVESGEIYFRVDPVANVYKLVGVGATASETFVGKTNSPVSKGKLFKDDDESVTLRFKREGFETVTKEFSGLALTAFKQSTVYPEESVPSISLGAESNWSKFQVKLEEQWPYLLVALGFGLASGVFHIVAIKPEQKRAYALMNLRAQGAEDDKYIGTLVRDYRIVKLLGKGGNGAVYKAVPDSLFGTARADAQAVAVKFCLPNGVDDLDEIRERFGYEVKALLRLSGHPNILRYIEDGETEDPDPDKRVPYLITEYVEGKTLDELVSKREKVKEKNHLGEMETKEVVTYHTLPPQTIHDYLAPIADALEYAHQRNCFHRDLKPLNIIITKEGRPVLLDFGLAKTEDNKLTKTGRAMGTGIYMPMEQWIDTKRVTSQVDIYALGVMMFHMLCGSTPFGDEDRLLVIGQMIITGNYLKLKDLKSDLDPEMGAVVEKMIAPDADNRYKSPKEALEDFARTIQG